MPPTERRALFLDRDGTLIPERGYLRDPRQVQLNDGAGEALAHLQQLGYFLVVVSNQSGIGRGLITLEEAKQVHERIITSLAPFGIELNAVYYCPHRPEEACVCRKPAPGMLLRAAQEWHLDLRQSILVGDRASDVAAGQRAGCRTILLAPSADAAGCQPPPDAVALGWPDVLTHIQQWRGAPS